MKIEIQQPELVSLIEKRMQDSSFESVDKMLIDLARFGMRSGETQSWSADGRGGWFDRGDRPDPWPDAGNPKRKTV